MIGDPQFVPMARGHVYGFLARAFVDPSAARMDELRQQLPLLESSLEALGDDDTRAAALLLSKAFGPLDTTDLQASHRRCFGHAVSKECPPYEAEYGQSHIFQKSQCLADVAGFYRAFGLDLAEDFHDRADHISAELDFMQWLCLKEARAVSSGAAEHLALCEDAQAGFLRDHIGRWIPTFTARVRKVGAESFHALAAAVLAAFVTAETRTRGVESAAEMPLNEMGGPQDDEAAGCAACAAAGGPSIASRGNST